MRNNQFVGIKPLLLLNLQRPFPQFPAQLEAESLSSTPPSFPSHIPFKHKLNSCPSSRFSPNYSWTVFHSRQNQIPTEGMCLEARTLSFYRTEQHPQLLDLDSKYRIPYRKIHRHRDWCSKGTPAGSKHWGSVVDEFCLGDGCSFQYLHQKRFLHKNFSLCSGVLISSLKDSL